MFTFTFIQPVLHYISEKLLTELKCQIDMSAIISLGGVDSQEDIRDIGRTHLVYLSYGLYI